MNTIDRIVEKLAKYPDVRFLRKDSLLTIYAQTSNGFNVSIEQLPTEFVVAFEGWHEHFKDEADALNCFVFGLSEECRLRIVSRGGIDCCWIVEALKEGNWIPKE